MKHVAFTLVFLLFGCSTLENMLLDNENYQEMQFEFNGEVKIEFVVPSGSRSLLATEKTKKALNQGISSDDFNEKNHFILPLLNLTYGSKARITYSGDHSIYSGISSTYGNNKKPLKSIFDLKFYEESVHLEEYNEVVSFEVKTFNSKNWLWREIQVFGQNIVFVVGLLDEDHYIFFSFEYLGRDDENIIQSRILAETVLNSYRQTPLNFTDV